MATFKDLVLSVCAYGDALQSVALALREKARTKIYADFNDEAAKIIGEKYGVEPHASRKATNGRNLLTFEKDTAAEQRLSAIRKLHADYAKSGGKQSTKEEVEVPADIAALAAKLVALCNEYEEAKKLAALAVAQAFAS